MNRRLFLSKLVVWGWMVMAGSPETQSSVSAELLRRLQESVLRSVLLKQPLPGRADPVLFPDLTFVERQPAIYLLDENLAPSVTVAGTRAPVTVLSSTEVLARARSEGDLAYFYFSAPK